MTRSTYLMVLWNDKTFGAFRKVLVVFVLEMCLTVGLSTGKNYYITILNNPNLNNDSSLH